MLPGVNVRDLSKSIDERGSFAELLRNDWRDILGDDRIAQANLSLTYPGTIRAWHRHMRGQTDYLITLKGTLKICVYDDLDGSPTRGHLDEIIASDEKLRLIRVPGQYWHGTKTLGVSSSLTLYFVSRLYDSKHPDEERRAWDDPSVVDPKTSKSFNWNAAPHK
jgi:dTDP-4-dehydrorhamnose 3,5-epimerase